MKILVAGSLAFDKILDFPGRFSEHILPDRIHDLNVSFVTENLSENFGGTAGNISYNLACLGATPLLLSQAGNDFGAYKDWLESKGVETSLVKIDAEHPTMFVTIMTDQSDNQIAAVYLGAAISACNTPDERIPKADMGIVAPGNVHDMRRFPEFFKEKGLPYIFDPGQQIPALQSKDLRSGMDGAAVVISNDYELAMIKEKTGWTEKDIVEKAGMLVTTLGERGSEIRTKEGAIHIPPAEVKDAKDPTGAGDAYRAGFTFGLLKKWPLEVSGRFAGVVAAYAVESLGTQAHEFSLHSARARYAENFGKELPS